jgi:hypothetical protein
MVEVELTALETIFDDNYADWAPSSTDLESWEEVTASGSDTTVTLVGLFGGDLTAFLEDCTAATDDCDPADYDGFSGWAFGIEWTPAAAATRLRQATVDDINTLVFADRLIAAQVTWVDGDNTLITSDVDVDEITADAPASGDITDTAVTDAFDRFWGDVSVGLDGPQYAVYFQEEGADIYYEVDSESTVWAYLANAAGESTDVTWAGAAQLTAAAGAVAVALLF